MAVVERNVAAADTCSSYGAGGGRISNRFIARCGKRNRRQNYLRVNPCFMSDT